MDARLTLEMLYASYGQPVTEDDLAGLLAMERAEYNRHMGRGEHVLANQHYERIRQYLHDIRTIRNCQRALEG